MIIDLEKPVEQSRDPANMFSLLTALVGQRCLKAEIAAGDELLLHIGDPIAYAHPKLAHEKRGTWILTTRASGWRLLFNDPPLLIESGWFPDDLRNAIFGDFMKKRGKNTNGPPISGVEVENKARALSGKTILSIEPYGYPMPDPIQMGFGLIIHFSGYASLAMVPSQEVDLDEDPMADWELYTPYHTYLRVGPGPVWSYLRSDQPAKTA